MCNPVKVSSIPRAVFAKLNYGQRSDKFIAILNKTISRYRQKNIPAKLFYCMYKYKPKRDVIILMRGQ